MSSTPATTALCLAMQIQWGKADLGYFDLNLKCTNADSFSTVGHYAYTFQHMVYATITQLLMLSVVVCSKMSPANFRDSYDPKRATEHAPVTPRHAQNHVNPDSRHNTKTTCPGGVWSMHLGYAHACARYQPGCKHASLYTAQNATPEKIIHFRDGEHNAMGTWAGKERTQLRAWIHRA